MEIHIEIRGNMGISWNEPSFDVKIRIKTGDRTYAGINDQE